MRMNFIVIFEQRQQRDDGCGIRQDGLEDVAGRPVEAL